MQREFFVNKFSVECDMVLRQYDFVNGSVAQSQSKHARCEEIFLREDKTFHR